MTKPCLREARRKQHERAADAAARIAASTRRSPPFFWAVLQIQATQGTRVLAVRIQVGGPERYQCSSWPLSQSAWGRTLEQLVRLKKNLHRSRHVSGNIRLNRGKEPTLALH